MAVLKGMDDKYKQEVESYIDGEMDEDASKRFEETLKQFPALQDYYNKIVRQKELVKQWWGTKKHH